MKVLYLGVYKNGTGWGNAARDTILALDAVGVDVVPRHINMAMIEGRGEIPSRLAALEKKPTAGCDVVIQHILPNMMDYNGEFKRCIGIFESETSHFRRSAWNQYLNLMDEVWVPNNQMVQASRESNVTVPVTVVPHPCDVSKYAQRYNPYPMPEIKDKFIFYTIGELTRRKNLVSLLKAFHLEFHPQEPVALLIKAHLPNQSPVECGNHINVIISDVKRELKLYDIPNYHQEVIIMQELTDEEIMKLHATCDCFVMPSFGEAWCIPAFDAMAMGKTPICTDVGGMHDFLTTREKMTSITRDFNGNPMGPDTYKTAGWLIPATPTPVFGNQTPIPNLFVGDEDWMDIHIGALRKAMREAFENKELRKEKAALGIDRAYDYSYEAVGQQMKTLLES